SPAVEATELPAAAVAAEDQGGAPQPAKPALSLRSLFEEAADDEGPTGKPRKVDPEAELALTELYSWTAPFSPEDFRARDQAREADAALQSPRSALYLALAEDD